MKKLAVALVFIVVFWGGVSFLGTLNLGGPKYEVIDLGTLGGATCFPMAINEKGQVVGVSETSEGERHAFIWDATGGIRRIPGAQLPSSRALFINDRGVVVCMEMENPPRPSPRSTLGRGRDGAIGYPMKPLLRHSFLWTEEAGRIDFKDPNHQSFEILGVSNDGMVLCASRTTLSESQRVVESRTQPFLFDAQLRLASFTTPLSASANLTRIVNSGMMFGSESGNVFQGPRSRRQARGKSFLMNGDKVTYLEDPGPNLEFNPVALNDRGEVLGVLFDFTATGNEGPAPVIWSATNGMNRLKTLPRHETGASDLNSRGQVVGGSTPITLLDWIQTTQFQADWIIDLTDWIDRFILRRTPIALLWDRGELIKLSDCVDLPRDLGYLSNAIAINDKGWITAVAEKDRRHQLGVLLIPDTR